MMSRSCWSRQCCRLSPAALIWLAYSRGPVLRREQSSGRHLCGQTPSSPNAVAPQRAASAVRCRRCVLRSLMAHDGSASPKVYHSVQLVDPAARVRIFRHPPFGYGRLSSQSSSISTACSCIELLERHQPLSKALLAWYCQGILEEFSRMTLAGASTSIPGQRWHDVYGSSQKAERWSR